MLNSKRRIKVILSRWDTHIKSWSLLNVKKYIIKYEDLINNTEKHFLELIDFIRKDLKIQFKLNSKKFNNIIKNTSFKKLQENEKIIGFDEVYKGKFFRKGLSKQWENILSEDQNIKIKKEFYITLKKFNYI